jgi:hypothetical protein
MARVHGAGTLAVARDEIQRSDRPVS